MILLAIGPMQLAMILPILLFPIVALVDVLRNNFKGNDKFRWILVIIALPILGAILYLLFGRGNRVRK